MCETHRKIVSNGEPTKKFDFLSFYFCVLFSEGTPLEKYFSVGIRIFPWVFAHTEIFEFLVVQEDPAKYNIVLLFHNISINLLYFL